MYNEWSLFLFKAWELKSNYLFNSKPMDESVNNSYTNKYVIRYLQSNEQPVVTFWFNWLKFFINFIRNNLFLFLLSISLEIAFNYFIFIFQHYPGQTLLCFAKFVLSTRRFPPSHSFPVCIIFAKDVGNSISSVRFSRAFLQVRNFYYWLIILIGLMSFKQDTLMVPP